MNDIIIAEFRWMLKQELIYSYGLNDQEAYSAIKNSYVEDMLVENPDFILHYSLKDTANDVYKEFMKIPIEI
ncbi:hypothetical protein KQI61_07905 [Anaerocolumna aminovalerica]|uniref:hypothetical protein n=1 Tax=Anaerocolumna aminovalerica TaxID=1527 RepID=UPI001C0EA0E9|nr:hypothetical protein [Anaerocolumna aminovalerica]MBU5332120.1 hypothetical protein [Anaerocolumna aminovalerica]